MAAVSPVVYFAITLVLFGWPVISYNRFARQRQLIAESWHDVDVELTRRHDLIPNLVTAVRAAAAHEARVLDAVTTARAAALEHAGEGPGGRARYEAEASRCAKELIALAEAYPRLRATENFAALAEQLTTTEDRIAAARRFYNNNVRSYNSRLGSVPSNIVGRVFRFAHAEFFQRDAGAEARPQL